MKTAVEFLITELDLIKFNNRQKWVMKRKEIIEIAKATERKQIIDAYWAGINGTINDYSEAVKINSEIMGIKTGKGADKYYDDTFQNPETK